MSQVVRAGQALIIGLPAHLPLARPHTPTARAPSALSISARREQDKSGHSLAPTPSRSDQPIMESAQARKWDRSVELAVALARTKPQAAPAWPSAVALPAPGHACRLPADKGQSVCCCCPVASLNNNDGQPASPADRCGCIHADSSRPTRSADSPLSC